VGFNGGGHASSRALDSGYRYAVPYVHVLKHGFVAGKYGSFEKEFNIRIGYRFGLWTRKGSISEIPIDT
jgi:hypothetical protein